MLRALSRLPVGSSARISFGSPASARAIATRWRSPPESCSGVCPRRSPRPRRSSHGRRALLRLAHAHPAEQQLQRGVLDRRDPGHQPVALIDEPDVAHQVLRGLVRRRAAVRSRPCEADRALLGRAAARRSAAAAWSCPTRTAPARRRISPAVHAQAHAVDRADLLACRPVVLDDALELEHAHARARSPGVAAQRAARARARGRPARAAHLRRAPACGLRRRGRSTRRCSRAPRSRRRRASAAARGSRPARADPPPWSARRSPAAVVRGRASGRARPARSRRSPAPRGAAARSRRRPRARVPLRRASARRAARTPDASSGQHHVVENLLALHGRKRLLAVADAGAEQRLRRERRGPCPSKRTTPVSGGSMPAAIRSSVERPEPRRPHTTASSPVLQRKGDVAQHDALVLAVAVALADRFEREQAHGRGRGVTVRPSASALTSRRAYCHPLRASPRARDDSPRSTGRKELRAAVCGVPVGPADRGSAGLLQARLLVAREHRRGPPAGRGSAVRAAARTAAGGGDPPRPARPATRSYSRSPFAVAL